MDIIRTVLLPQLKRFGVDQNLELKVKRAMFMEGENLFLIYEKHRLQREVQHHWVVVKLFSHVNLFVN